MNDALPLELNRRWGHLPHVKKRGNGEWSAACPSCRDAGHHGTGLPDRFRIFEDGERSRGWCRQCDHFEWLNEGKKGFKPDPAVIERLRQEQIAAEQSRKKEAERALKLLNDDRIWERYCEEMPDHARNWWRSEGIPDWAQTYLQLGYCPEKSVWFDGRQHVTPTYTIPVFDVGWNLVNLRHRLVNPPTSNDKYRPDRAGLPASLYFTNPEEKLHDHVIAVEGEKKAIVVWVTLEDYDTVSVVGLPGKCPGESILSRLESASRVTILLDPDADPARIAQRLGQRVRIVRLPLKVDDAITRYGLNKANLQQLIRKAAAA